MTCSFPPSVFIHRILHPKILSAMGLEFLVCVLSHFNCVRLCDPMDCSLPCSSVHEKYGHSILLSTPVFLPGKSHGQRSLVSCSPWSWTWLSDFPFTFYFHALDKEMATHSSVLAWRIPGTGEPGGLPSMGSRRVRHYWSDLAAAAAGSADVWNWNIYPV